MEVLEGVGVQDVYVVFGYCQFFYVCVFEEGVGFDVMDLGIGYKWNLLDVIFGLVCYCFWYICIVVVVDSQFGDVWKRGREKKININEYNQINDNLIFVFFVLYFIFF